MEAKFAEEEIMLDDKDLDYVTVKEGLTSPRFYFLSWLLFQGIFFGIYMASVYKVCAIDVLDDMSLTIAGAIGSVCNGGSRIMWASL
jgi:hypothetical protein